MSTVRFEPRARAGRRRHAAFCIAGFIGSTAVFAAYTSDPAGAGFVAFAALAAVFILVTAVVPMALGARPRHIWSLGSAGCVCLLLSLVSEAVGGSIGPVTYPDVFYFLGYVFLILWFAMLWRRMRAGGTRLTAIAAFTATTSVALTLWCGVLAPTLGGSQLPRALVAAVYPTMDVLMLVLLVALARRVQVLTTSLRILVATFALLLLIDGAFTTARVLNPELDTAPFMASYIFFLYGLAAFGSHPSVSRMAQPRVGSGEPLIDKPSPLLVLITIAPILLSTAIPETGLTDVVVRGCLLVTLLGLLCLRLTQTTVALSRAEGDSRHRATHDGLTGLLNRPALLEHLADRLALNAVDGRYTAVLFLDCDDFKHFNDTWGHAAGDRLLTHVSAGLPAHLRPDDVLARHGGDEFVVVATLEHPEDAGAISQRVQGFFGEPMTILPGHSHPVTSSVGVAVAGPTDEVTPQELLSRADIAMYEAKRADRGQTVQFDDGLARVSRTRAAVGARLGDALRNERFEVLLQPIMGGPDYTRVVAWEALARWRDPDLGEISPEVFVPVAEQLGLIGDLGEVVLRRACRDLACLRLSLKRDDLRVSVNVSPAQLLRPGFAAAVRTACSDAGLPGDGLVLEVTETLLVDEGPGVLDTLDEIRGDGVAVFIDDFGTGYASLSTLLRLPVDCVKLDGSLVARIGVDPDARRQLAAVRDLVRSLGIELIVAEGVETRTQEAVLLDLGFPMVQGWLYGRPADPATVIATSELSNAEPL